MKKGNLVRHTTTNERFYVVLYEKKFTEKYKDRIQVISTASSKKHWFLEEELEVLNEV